MSFVSLSHRHKLEKNIHESESLEGFSGSCLQCYLLKHVKEKGTSKISVCNFVYTYHRHYTTASILYTPVFYTRIPSPILCFVCSNPCTRMPWKHLNCSHLNGGWLPENRCNWWNWTTWKIVNWRNLLVDLMNFDSEHLKFKSSKT